MGRTYIIAYNDKYYVGGKNIITESIFLKNKKVAIFSSLYKLCKKFANDIVEVRLIDNDYCKIKFGLLKIDSQRSLIIVYKRIIKVDYVLSSKIGHIDHLKNIDCAIKYYEQDDIYNYLKSIDVNSEILLFSENKKSVVVIVKDENKYQTNLYQFGMKGSCEKPVDAIENNKPHWFESPSYYYYESNTREEIIEFAKKLIQEINDHDRL